MQALTAAPRAGLTAGQVLSILTAPAVEVDSMCELLDGDLNVVEDITVDYVPAGGSVTWDGSQTANANRDCSFGLSRELQWGTDLVRLSLLLTVADVTAQFYQGVYCLTTPQNPSLGADRTLFQVTGYDRLYLLQREVGDTYSVAAGVPVLAAVADTIAAAGLTGVDLDESAAAATVPSDMVWPLVPSSGQATTWLDIVNALLALVAYVPLWADEVGGFRAHPALTLAQRPAEFTLDATDSVATVVGQVRSLVEDQWAAPNRWIFVQSGFTGTPTEGDGLYTVVNQSDGPSSIDSRGLTWAAQFTVDAADQATLERLGDAQVAADRQVMATFTVPTGPLPICGHDDVLGYVEPAAGDGVLKAQVTGWTLPLDGGDMTWTLQVAT